MRKLILIILVSALNLCITAQDISFYRENITMKIANDRFYVSGSYYYQYDKSDSKLLFYPFPSDPVYGEPDSVFIYDLTNDIRIQPVREDSSVVFFVADFSRYHNIIIQVSYQQQLLGNRAEYILETTQAWRKPLEEATYQLIIPSNLKVSRFSILPGDSIITPREKIYTWQKLNYMPEDDMVFDFEKRPE